MYNCNCFKTVLTEDIKAATELNLLIPNMTLHHGQRVRIVFAQTPPAIVDGPLKVVVNVNGIEAFVLQDRMCGAHGAISFLYTDNLARTCDGAIKSRQFIDLIFSADTSTFKYVGPCSCLRRSNIAFPPFAPATSIVKKEAKSSVKKETV